MAIQNHPSLYTGGSERFNLQPHVNLYAQLAAKKQARDDAFDEYMRNLNKNINSAGLRNVDRDAFDAGLADFQKFGIENRDAIRSRKGGADIVYHQKYQDLHNIIAESKGEEEKLKPFVEMRLDPEKWQRVNQESAIREIDLHNQPIRVRGADGLFQRNTGRKSIDYNSFTFNPKKLTDDDWRQYEEGLNKQVPPDETILPSRVDPSDKYFKIDGLRKSYSPEKLKAISDISKRDFATNKEIAYTFRDAHPFDKWVKNNGAEFNKLNNAYKAANGADANIEDEDDLFAAQQVLKRLQPTITEKRIDNRQLIDGINHAQAKELENLRNRNAIGRIRLHNDLKDEDEEVAVDDEMIDAFRDAYGRASNMAKDKVGVALTTLKPSTQAVLIDKAKKLMGDEKISQADLYIRKGGEKKVDLMGYMLNEKGERTTARKLGTIDFVDMNIPANTPLGIKAKREVMEQGKSNKPSTKKYKGLDASGNPIFE